MPFTSLGPLCDEPLKEAGQIASYLGDNIMFSYINLASLGYLASMLEIPSLYC